MHHDGHAYDQQGFPLVEGDGGRMQRQSGLNRHGSERRAGGQNVVVVAVVMLKGTTTQKKKATEQPAFALRGGHAISGPRVQHQPACGTWLVLPA
jgi:hypothetical protein